MIDEIIRELEQKVKIAQGKNYIVSNLSNETIKGDMRGWVCGHFYEPRQSRFQSRSGSFPKSGLCWFSRSYLSRQECRNGTDTGNDAAGRGPPATYVRDDIFCL